MFVVEEKDKLVVFRDQIDLWEYLANDDSNPEWFETCMLQVEEVGEPDFVSLADLFFTTGVTPVTLPTGDIVRLQYDVFVEGGAIYEDDEYLEAKTWQPYAMYVFNDNYVEQFLLDITVPAMDFGMPWTAINQVITDKLLENDVSPIWEEEK